MAFVRRISEKTAAFLDELATAHPEWTTEYRDAYIKGFHDANDMWLAVMVMRYAG